MHEPIKSFNGPQPRTEEELNDWMDAYITTTRREAKRLAITPSADAAADMLDFLHIDFHIEERDAEVLELVWKYKIKIRRIIPKFLPKARVFTKRDAFPSYQIASMIARMPDTIREIGADSLVMAYMEDYRYLCDMGELPKTTAEKIKNDDPEVGNEEILALIEDSYPGQLATLYHQIRTGTLGK